MQKKKVYSRTKTKEVKELQITILFFRTLTVTVSYLAVVINVIEKYLILNVECKSSYLLINESHRNHLKSRSTY